jgi:hypothetical protein
MHSLGGPGRVAARRAQSAVKGSTLSGLGDSTSVSQAGSRKGNLEVAIKAYEAATKICSTSASAPTSARRYAIDVQYLAQPRKSCWIAIGFVRSRCRRTEVEVCAQHADPP